MSTVNQAKLVSACRNLIALIDDPQPGLATWNSMCAQEARNIEAAFARAEPASASAVGRVVELDAADLDPLAENPKHPGLVTITLTCTLGQSREWSRLFGKTVRAELLAEAGGEAAEPSQQALLPGVES